MAIFWMGMSAASPQEADRLADQHFKKAIDLLKQTQYQDAIAEYEKVISLLPESEIALDARYWIGQTYFQMGKHDEALSIFRKLIQEYPDSTIAPVTQLMVARVEKEKKSVKARAKRDISADKKIIIDPKTGATYKRIAVHTGKKDIIETPIGLILSPNGKFLLKGHIVIPIKDGEPFDLLEEKPVLRGTWSPDGKMLAYYSENAIWIVPVSPETGRPTGPAKKLLDGKYIYQHPVSWSPDSTKIAFPRRDERTEGDIWTLSIENGTLTQLTDDPGYESNACWSPDGKTLAYRTRGQVEEIRLVSTHGGESEKIIGMEYGRLYSWSPDGKWLAYDTRQKLHLFQLADKRAFAIDSLDEVGHFFAWSKDGKKMFFYRSSYDWASTLRIVSTSGGPSFRLARKLELWPFRQFWSADSDKIITQRAGDGMFVIVPLSGGESISIELDVLLNDNLQPLSLSPDRKNLLYSIELENGNEDLYTVPISLKEARTAGSPVAVFRDWDRRITRIQSSWSPDSRNVALVHKGDIWVTSSDWEKPIQITNTSEIEGGPSWSPGGEKIAYISQREEGDARLMIVSASGGEPVTIVGHFDEWHWSPNGRELFVISGKKVLNIPITEGNARVILDLEDKGFTDRIYGLSWLQDRKHVAFVGRRETGNQTQIYIANINTGEVIELASDDEGWKDKIYVSPDGKWISYNTDGFVKTRPRATIWEVEVEELVREKKK
jgi:Tol biopolymer transport system component